MYITPLPLIPALRIWAQVGMMPVDFGCITKEYQFTIRTDGAQAIKTSLTVFNLRTFQGMAIILH